jgi:hypothetical protein
VTTSISPRSMKFSLDELLQGMLATIEGDRFSDDPARLATMFGDLAGRFQLFAPLGTGVTPEALEAALAKLQGRNMLSRADGHYTFAVEGREKCVSCKRTLFNQSDRGELEEAAKIFAAL